MGASGNVLYGPEEANRALPLVRSIVCDMVDEFRQLRTYGRERRSLEVASSGSENEQRRLGQLKEEILLLSERIERYLEELLDLGLEVRDLELGLVDFPTLVDGAPAFLSWRLGESDVAHWHPADRGFGERTPLPSTPALTP